MSGTSIETYEYNGYTIDIEPDYDAESPITWQEFPGEHIITFHRDYDINLNWESGDFGVYNTRDYGWMVSHELPSGNVEETMVRASSDISNHLVCNHGAEVLDVSAYIHSGITISARKSTVMSWPDQQWDVTHSFALIFMTEEDIKREISAYRSTNGYKAYDTDYRRGDNDKWEHWHRPKGTEEWIRGHYPLDRVRVTKADRDLACERMLGTVKEIDYYMTGQVYGFNISDQNGDGFDDNSCWGFIGDIKYAKEEAEACVDREIAWREERDKEILDTFVKLIEEDEVA